MKRRRRSRAPRHRPRILSAAEKEKYEQAMRALIREHPSAHLVIKRIAQVAPKPPYSKKEATEFLEKMEEILLANPHASPFFERSLALLKATYDL